MKRLGWLDRRPNPASRSAANPSALIREAVAGDGKPSRAHLAQALGVVTGAPWPARLRPGDPVTFSRDHVQVGHDADPSALSVPLTIVSPDEAWEAVAARGLIPMNWPGSTDRYFLRAPARENNFRWVGDGRLAGSIPVRRFDGTTLVSPDAFDPEPSPGDMVFYRPSSSLRQGTYELAFQSSPPSVALVVALAADSDRLEIIDDLSMEFVCRLKPWLHGEAATRPMRIGWGFSWSNAGDHWSPPPLERGALDAAQGSCFVAADARTKPAEAAAKKLTKGQEAENVVWAAEAAMRWWSLAQQQRRVSDAMGFSVVPRPLFKRSYADLPNPFEPLLALWALGYNMSDTIGPNVRLAVPPLVVPRADHRR